MDKLENNIVYNKADYPKIFGLTEQQTIEAMQAYREYNGDQSMSDWCRMYTGIHRESAYEQGLRGWLACIRWMNATPKQESP